MERNGAEPEPSIQPQKGSGQLRWYITIILRTLLKCEVTGLNTCAPLGSRYPNNEKNRSPIRMPCERLLSLGHPRRRKSRRKYFENRKRLIKRKINEESNLMFFYAFPGFFGVFLHKRKILNMLIKHRVNKCAFLFSDAVVLSVWEDSFRIMFY